MEAEASYDDVQDISMTAADEEGLSVQAEAGIPEPAISLFKIAFTYRR